MMIDLKRVRTLALDIAGARQSYELQDDWSEFIWHLLERHYRMFLFSTNPDEDLTEEDFKHPMLTFIPDEMPPGKELLGRHEEIGDPHTLWITDDAKLQTWLQDRDQPFMYLQRGKQEPPGGQFLPRLSELSTLLNPTALLMRDLGVMIDDLRRFRPQGALLVGLGGPPRSGVPDLAVDLRRQLQDTGHELVELLDLSSLMRSAESLLESAAPGDEVWMSTDAGTWVRESLLGPLRAGQAVYVEKRPERLPRDFDPHFPLYISEASVVLVFAEMLFVPDIAPALDLSILLELTPEETTRRLYEIPDHERFDPKFTEQYLSREGRIYQEYLRRHQVREKAGIRVDANESHALRLDDSEQGALV